MVMVATVVLRGEERVSHEACTFLFFGTLVLPLLYSPNFDIYISFLTYQLVFFVDAWSTSFFFFLLPSCILRERKGYCTMYLAPCRLTSVLDFLSRSASLYQQSFIIKSKKNKIWSKIQKKLYIFYKIQKIEIFFKIQKKNSNIFYKIPKKITYFPKNPFF